MRKLKGLIVDDDEVALKAIEIALNEHFKEEHDFHYVDTYSEAVQRLKENVYNFSILDNKLDAGKTCFHLVRLMPRKNFGIVVYTSDERKPFLDDALELLPDITFYKPYNDDETKIFLVDLDIKLQEQIRKKSTSIIIKDNGQTIKVPYENIYYLEALGSYTKFHFKFEEDEYRTSIITKTLKEFTYLIDDTEIFERCHRSYIINTSQIRAIEKSEELIRFKCDSNKLKPVHYSANMFNDWIQENY